MPNYKRKSLFPSFTNVLKFISGTALLLPFASLIKAVEADSQVFPEGGTFRQQSDYIASLQDACGSELGGVVTSIANSPNPFQSIGTYAQNGESVKVWHHDFDAKFGVLTRRTTETNKEKPLESVDTEEVMIGGESQDGTLQPLTFRFERDKNGLMKVVSKEKASVTEFAQGVEDAKKEGLVVRAEDCYTARLKDKSSAP
jgi:hypothetical protein